MIFISKQEVVRTIREMARTRKVYFDNSGAFLFNQAPHLNTQHVIDILSTATEGVVTVHEDRADLNKYSVVSPVQDVEIYLDADLRKELTVRAIMPIDHRN
ncbi:hypothetical protein [Hyalangium minutum]|uniref:Uncharacterized protein n=1 Tax=Hyalangium minutum TaxID=394096 RepID=A0A085W024_9BACT|nr:hypothetical protein [Hyalangium minutum]KFE61037.1 hypothetical protein DB31_4472 [Hyalangium minutum]